MLSTPLRSSIRDLLGSIMIQAITQASQLKILKELSLRSSRQARARNDLDFIRTLFNTLRTFIWKISMVILLRLWLIRANFWFHKSTLIKTIKPRLWGKMTHWASIIRSLNEHMLQRPSCNQVKVYSISCITNVMILIGKWSRTIETVSQCSRLNFWMTEYAGLLINQVCQTKIKSLEISDHLLLVKIIWMGAAKQILLSSGAPLIEIYHLSEINLTYIKG